MLASLRLSFPFSCIAGLAPLCTPPMHGGQRRVSWAAPPNLGSSLSMVAWAKPPHDPNSLSAPAEGTRVDSPLLNTLTRGPGRKRCLTLGAPGAPLPLWLPFPCGDLLLDTPNPA